MGAMGGPLGRLMSATRALATRWGLVCGLWTDEVQRQVQSDYWDPLEKEAEATAKAMAELGAVIDGARKEVK